MKSFHEDCLTLPKEVRRKPLTTCVNNGSPNLEIANFISTRTHYYQCAHQMVYVRESNAFLRHITSIGANAFHGCTGLTSVASIRVEPEITEADMKQTGKPINTIRQTIVRTGEDNTWELLHYFDKMTTKKHNN